MIGKKIKLNDYKFTYGQETIILNVYGVFKNIKDGNKYVIYSYENRNKLYYANAFVRNDELVVMTSKGDNEKVAEEFVNSILKEKENNDFKIISLDKISSVQVIDEHVCNFNVDLNKLFDLTIPKPEVVKEEVKPKKKVSIAAIFFGLFIVVVIVFFFVNPEVIMGKNKEYVCNKHYLHKELPASVNEEVDLVFSGKGMITEMDIKTDYVFNDVNYYAEFRDKSYFYQYITEGDTYKFEDASYTYRLFSKINVTEEFFLPSEESELISYYKNKGYECKVVEADE